MNKRIGISVAIVLLVVAAIVLMLHLRELAIIRAQLVELCREADHKLARASEQLATGNFKQAAQVAAEASQQLKSHPDPSGCSQQSGRQRLADYLAAHQTELLTEALAQAERAEALIPLIRGYATGPSRETWLRRLEHLPQTIASGAYASIVVDASRDQAMARLCRIAYRSEYSQHHAQTVIVDGDRGLDDAPRPLLDQMRRQIVLGLYDGLAPAGAVWGRYISRHQRQPLLVLTSIAWQAQSTASGETLRPQALVALIVGQALAKPRLVGLSAAPRDHSSDDVIGQQWDLLAPLLPQLSEAVTHAISSPPTITSLTSRRAFFNAEWNDTPAQVMARETALHVNGTTLYNAQGEVLENLSYVVCLFGVPFDLVYLFERERFVSGYLRAQIANVDKRLFDAIKDALAERHGQPTLSAHASQRSQLIRSAVWRRADANIRMVSGEPPEPRVHGPVFAGPGTFELSFLPAD